MRYVKKLDTPQFFMDDTANLGKWRDYGSTHELRDKKRKLKEYILDKEQDFLCIYCESRITTNKTDSHIEHIKPKEDNKYPELTFDYKNLVVSCQGNCHNKEDDNRRYSCGHRKNNEYNEELFLDPTTKTDIADYFEYEEYIDIEDDITKVRIKESQKEIDKSEYMIRILNLNDENTNITKERYLEFVKFENMIVEGGLDIDEIREFSRGFPFISYLRYKYPWILD